MNRIVSVRALDHLMLSVLFQNGVEKLYDIKKIIPCYPQYEVLIRDVELYRQVKVDAGGYGVSWNDELDLACDEIWEYGKSVGCREDMDIMMLLGSKLLASRVKTGLTQKQLSEKTGIYQADISKIERGLANPSISTLKRLAEGMGLKLEIGFK